MDRELNKLYYFNHITESWYYSDQEIISYFPSHWYEPATRIVLTEEEYSELEYKAKLYDDSNPI